MLLARIRAQLRQHEASEDAVFTIGPYTFRPSSKLLLNPKGYKVRLTEKETAILRYLYRAGQRPVSRETLLQEVWGYNSGVTTHTLETHIYRLRQKIEKDAANAGDPGDRSRRLQAGAVNRAGPLACRWKTDIALLRAGADARACSAARRCACSAIGAESRALQRGDMLFVTARPADGGYVVQRAPSAMPRRAKTGADEHHRRRAR